MLALHNTQLRAFTREDKSHIACVAEQTRVSLLAHSISSLSTSESSLLFFAADLELRNHHGLKTTGVAVNDISYLF